MRNDEEFDYMGFYVIVLTNGHTKELLQHILTDFWQLYIINVMVIQRINIETYTIYTYFPYTKEHCAKVVPTLYNYVNSGSFHNPMLFPRKLENLNNCPITVATFNVTPHMVLRPSLNGTWYADGIDGNLLRVIARRLNFSVVIKVPADGTAKGEYFELI